MPSAAPIRVLVIDDSAVMRSLLRMTLESCPDVQLIGMAIDGCAGLEAIEHLKPDLVLLDIEMPCLDGLAVLAQLRSRDIQVRVIMCSTLTRRGAGVTLEALARGATDYVTKPAAQHGVREGVAVLSYDLIPKIQALFSSTQKAASWALPPAQPQMFVKNPAAPKILVVGVSTGGPAALELFLPALPADFPIPVLIVQHMPQLFTGLLAERLDGLCPLTVREAQMGDVPRSGTIYLARGDWHMKVNGSPARSSLYLTQSEPEQHCRPSVDILFRSAVSVYGSRILAVMLTGMGSDGLDGCRAIHAAGGTVFAQDRQSSAVWGMPGVVVEAGLADKVLPLAALAPEIVRFVASSSRCATSETRTFA